MDENRRRICLSDTSDGFDSDSSSDSSEITEEDDGRIETDMTDGDDESTEDNGILDNTSEEDEEKLICSNCFRAQNNQLIEQFWPDETYTITFFDHTSDEIRCATRFRVVRKRSGRRKKTYKLCKECSHFLVREKDKTKASKNKFTWPSFVWTVLNNEKVKNAYGNKVWQFLPWQWRYWWIDTIKEKCPETYGDVTIKSPPCIFIDKTHEKKVWDDDVNSYLLSRLASCCNKYLLPNNLCPWGCTEFNHKCGYVSFDIVWQRYLQKIIIDLISKPSDIHLITSAREDFVRHANDYEYWLLNPSWRVKPSIAICSEGVFVLTCRDHNGGNDKYMLHPPRQPFHILPSKQPDQLCHAVIKPRTIKPMKACKYSNSFQMHEQRGTFNGIDTCNVTSYGRFDFCSKILN